MSLWLLPYLVSVTFMIVRQVSHFAITTQISSMLCAWHGRALSHTEHMTHPRTYDARYKKRKNIMITIMWHKLHQLQTQRTMVSTVRGCFKGSGRMWNLVLEAGSYWLGGDNG